ncbi:MAG: hypothetical protein ACFFAS_11470 [Promethearchaeota archaeon]
MKNETLLPGRSTYLRKNANELLHILINEEDLNTIYLINGKKFLTEKISSSHLIVEPGECYMVINTSRDITIEIRYNRDISPHAIVYNPFEQEFYEKMPLNKDLFTSNFDVPDNYVDVLPKWYSYKFIFANYNLIFIKPRLGLSFQFHELRSELWEILAGKPIIVNGNEVSYFVNPGSKFEIQKKAVHTIINTNASEYVLLKEQWDGEFNEADIYRLFNPNNYY